MGNSFIEGVKNNSDRATQGYGGLQLIFGIVMVAIGTQYLPKNSASENSEQRNPCPNGAANYLYVAGIVLIVCSLLDILSRFSKYMAEKDGKVTCGERCGLVCLKFISGLMMVVDTVIIIWGSVVVFGAWSRWTEDYEKFSNEPTKYNYCEYTPMMFAFVILILKWVLVPLLMMLMCCCVCLLAACGISAAGSGNQA